LKIKRHVNTVWRNGRNRAGSDVYFEMVTALRERVNDYLITYKFQQL
jgi:hypothetical protein